MAQSVERPISAQVMISRFVGSSPASGSVLTAQGLDPASDSVSPSLSLCSFPVRALSLSVSKINKHLKKIFFKVGVGTWVTQLVERLILAQVMISWFVGSSPTWGSVLTA